MEGSTTEGIGIEADINRDNWGKQETEIRNTIKIKKICNVKSKVGSEEL